MKEKLQKWLDDNHVSANKLAALSNVPKSTIYDILSGKINPLHVNVSRILAISEVTNISPEEFFDRQVQPDTRSDEEKRLLSLWRNATEESRKTVLMVLESNQIVKKEEAI